MNQDNLLDCPELLKEFLFYMETIRGRSPKTIDGYYIDLRLFLRYIKSVKVLNKIPQANDEEFKAISIRDLGKDVICKVTLADVYEFLHFCLDKLKNGSAIRARKVSSIRAFYKYLSTKTTYLEENPVKNLEVPTLKKAMPKYLTLEESMELLDHVKSRTPYRDYCILTLFLNCGMRVSELVGIDILDIREDTLRLLGKGNKERIIYLNQACLDAIEDYIKKERKPPKQQGEQYALFVSRNGQRITSRRVEQIVAQCLEHAGLDGRGYSPHKLRHTAATLLYQHGGVDIRVLKEILGHANLGTTEIYTHVSNQQIRNAAEKSPLANVTKHPKQSVQNILNEDNDEDEE